ncbi:MAG: GerW family sporulation protein [Candidatus Kapaibacterium sp.]
MKPEIDEVISKVTDFLRDEAKTETVVGKQFQLGDFTCVPVIRLGMGFGFGGGEGEGDNKKTGAGKGEGAGGGAGAGMEPLGFLVTKGELIQFVPTHTSKGLSVMFEKAPEMLAKYFEKKENGVKA